MSKAAIPDELESVKIGSLKGFGSIVFAIAERVAGLEAGHHGPRVYRRKGTFFVVPKSTLTALDRAELSCLLC